MIRLASLADAASICEIYNHYVLNTIVTFEEQPVPVDEMASRIKETMQAFPWFVAEDESGILGYSYASKWKARSAYRYSAEATVYLRAEAVGKGLGTQLYRTLLAELTRLGVHTVIGGVSLPNSASVGLHEKLGFVKVAEFSQVGFKFDDWINVGYWQLILDANDDAAVLK